MATACYNLLLGNYLVSLKELQLSNSPLRRLPDFIHLGRLDRPIGIYLLMWPTLWALWIAAEGMPTVKLLFVFIMGTIITRTAGCIVNDFADRNLDGQVQRTANRPLATGRVSGKEALALASLLGLAAFGLVWLTNQITILMSVVALVLACSYPLMKRYTYLPQLVLGAAFAWAVPMAFTAVQETVPSIAWLIYLATLLWTMAYDTLYAMVDREDDLKAGIKSSAILFGEADLLMIAILESITVLALWLLGQQLQFSIWYDLGLAVAVTLWARQLWLCRDRSREQCFRAFLNNHWVGASIFTGLFFHYATA